MKAPVRKAINDLIKQHKQIMLLFENGRCYLLRNHWTYLDPEDAKRVLICDCPIPRELNLRDSNRGKGKICYLTDFV